MPVTEPRGVIGNVDRLDWQEAEIADALVPAEAHSQRIVGYGVGRKGSSAYWRAECSCGWLGNAKNSWPNADAQRWYHHRQATSGALGRGGDA